MKSFWIMCIRMHTRSKTNKLEMEWFIIHFSENL